MSALNVEILDHSLHCRRKPLFSGSIAVVDRRAENLLNCLNKLLLCITKRKRRVQLDISFFPITMTPTIFGFVSIQVVQQSTVHSCHWKLKWWLSYKGNVASRKTINQFHGTLWKRTKATDWKRVTNQYIRQIYQNIPVLNNIEQPLTGLQEIDNVRKKIIQIIGQFDPPLSVFTDVFIMT